MDRELTALFHLGDNTSRIADSYGVHRDRVKDALFASRYGGSSRGSTHRWDYEYEHALFGAVSGLKPKEASHETAQAD